MNKTLLCSPFHANAPVPMPGLPDQIRENRWPHWELQELLVPENFPVFPYLETPDTFVLSFVAAG